MATETNTKDTNKPRVLPTLTAAPQVPADPNADKGPKQSFNNQKARTADEEKAAWRRRIRRWHRKANIALGLEMTRSLLVEAQGYTVDETKDDK